MTGRHFFFALIVSFISLLAIAVSVVAQAQAPSSPALHLQAELLKTVDASHAKVGDEITARTALPLEIGGRKFPVGSTVIGRVTEIGPNQLGLIFDRITVKKTTPVPIGLSLRAVMMPHGAPASTGEEISPSANSGPGGGLLRSPTIAAQDSSVSIFDGNHPVTAGNGGVVGLPGVQLTVNVDPKAGCVFQGNPKQGLKLEKGLQLMFVASAP